MILTSMKMDIPFLSSIWALGSSDTGWTSSEQSIIHSIASLVICRGMCVRLNLLFSDSDKTREVTHKFRAGVPQLNVYF